MCFKWKSDSVLTSTIQVREGVFRRLATLDSPESMVCSFLENEVVFP